VVIIPTALLNTSPLTIQRTKGATPSKLDSTLSVSDPYTL
jgi:hypothetical protein